LKTGLTKVTVNSTGEIDTLLQRGKGFRMTGKTNMNSASSRSHAIFTVTVETASKSEHDDEAHIKVGKLNMVDLAGKYIYKRIRRSTKCSIVIFSLEHFFIGSSFLWYSYFKS
jgi:hypothetical protein